MNPDPPHQTPLKATNQAVKGLEGEHKQPFPALVQHTLKTNHASVQKNHNNHQSVKKTQTGTNQKSEATTTHQPQLSFFTAACVSTPWHCSLPKED